ncbi:hypothetical protein ABFS83_08G177700 [Erythranthe nasuta]
MDEEMAARVSPEAKSKLEKKYRLPISVQAFALAVHGVRFFDSKHHPGDETLEKSVEILECACKLVLEQLKNCTHEIEFREKAYELRRALVELIELHRDKHLDSQLWVARLKSERDSASFYMGDFLYQWDFAFDLFLDESAPKKIKLYREYASNIASLYCPVLNKSIFKESSVVPREKSRNIVRFLDDIQSQLIKRFKCLLTVEACHVAEVLSMRTDVPITQILPSINDHKKKAIYMTKQRVVNQERVINEIYETLSVSGPISTRPRGSFLLLGGSGVGKTEIAKAVALHWYCDASRLVEIDMSEYAELPQLESANCDLVEWSKRMHHEFWNRLTEIVAKRPYSVILLDKVDKASSIVTRILVEVLSYGAPSDSKRSIVDFSKSIIFMTSSVGSTQLPPLLSSTNWNEDVLEQLRRNPIEFYRARNCNLRDSYERVLPEARRIFDAELLNSVDKILVVRRFDK